ncbi:hypothetical protein F2Q70_00004599 [Brassica cretica]|uniref:Uncharacterized protein n=1 Tax=Brassica cretica TaxID=69181 RepID=A0A8S9IXE0_BRACR|nr:hypothetical protein F2Q70_00004599 [Brassica cretica]
MKIPRNISSELPRIGPSEIPLKYPDEVLPRTRIENEKIEEIQTPYDGETEGDANMQEAATEELDGEKDVEEEDDGKEKATGETEKRQGGRRRLLKPALATGASNKLKMAKMERCSSICIKGRNTVFGLIIPNTEKERFGKMVYGTGIGFGAGTGIGFGAGTVADPTKPNAVSGNTGFPWAFLGALELIIIGTYFQFGLAP